MGKLVFILFIIGCNLFTYCEIREILWSIVWADRGGKYRKLAQYRKELRAQQSVSSRISMQYLTDTLKRNRQAFDFWRRMKLLFAIFELLMLVLYVIHTVSKKHYEFGLIEDYVQIIQTLFCFLLIRLQFREGKYTKYDLERMKRK